MDTGDFNRLYEDKNDEILEIGGALECRRIRRARLEELAHLIPSFSLDMLASSCSHDNRNLVERKEKIVQP